MTYVHVGIHLKGLYFLQEKVLKFACLAYFNLLHFNIITSHAYQIFILGILRCRRGEPETIRQQHLGRKFLHVYIILMVILWRQTILIVVFVNNGFQIVC